MGDEGSQGKEKESTGVSGKAADALVNAAAAEKKAQATIADANTKLNAAIHALRQAKVGKSEERKAARAVRAAVSGLVKAKRKLKKAQKKRAKAMAKQAPKERAKPVVHATEKPKPSRAARARASRRAPKPKPARRAAPKPFTPTVHAAPAEDRGAAMMEREGVAAHPAANSATDA